MEDNILPVEVIMLRLSTNYCVWNKNCIRIADVMHGDTLSTDPQTGNRIAQRVVNFEMTIAAYWFEIYPTMTHCAAYHDFMNEEATPNLAPTIGNYR